MRNALLAGFRAVQDIVQFQNTSVAVPASSVSTHGTMVTGPSATSLLTWSFWVRLSSAQAGRSGDDGQPGSGLYLLWMRSLRDSGAGFHATLTLDGLGSSTHAALRGWESNTGLKMRVDLAVPYDDRWHHVHVVYNAGWTVTVDGLSKTLALNDPFATGAAADAFNSTGSGRIMQWNWKNGTHLGPVQLFRRNIAHGDCWQGSFPWPYATHKAYAGGGTLPGEVLVDWIGVSPEDDKSSNGYNFLLS